MTPAQRKNYCATYLADRERGRTDLLWLCQNVLGYVDVTGADERGENHQPLLDGLHHFKGRHEQMDMETGAIVHSSPRVEMWDQEEPDGKRNYLFLFPRDHLKTTVVTIAHSIQWIINYYDVRILLSVASGVQSNQLMNALLGHFRNNPKFRYLYPEVCPELKRASDWGSLEHFTVPNRTRQIKEPTMMAVTIGKIIAGTHQDVHKHSDLVDKENVKTVNQIKDVNDHFGYTDPLLARVNSAQGWRDVEGTRYDFSDLYGTILDHQNAIPDEERSYRIIERAAEADPKAQRTLWESRYDWEALMAIKRNPLMSLYMYEAQYNQRVIPPSGGLATRDEIESMWIPRKKVRELMPLYRVHTTVDLASMKEQSEGAFEAIVTCGFLPSGAIHVIDVTHGHLTPFEVIANLFDVWKRYHPIDIKIEANHHAQVLEPFLNQEMNKRGIWLPVTLIPRSNAENKDERIKGLQPFIHAKRIRIVDDLPCDGQLILEMARWPRYKFKDIVDALSDQLQHAEGDGIEPDLYPVPKIEPSTTSKFRGFDPITHLPMFEGQESRVGIYFEGTGM